MAMAISSRRTVRSGSSSLEAGIRSTMTHLRLAPFSAAIAVFLALVSIVLGINTFQSWQQEQAEANWSPFSWHEIEASSDGEILYFELVGHKTTTLALNAQVHSFVIGGVLEHVACYRPDGTLCVPNRAVGAATDFRSPVLRVIIPSEVVSDSNSAFRICYTYGDQTWCDQILMSEVRTIDPPDDGFEVIVPAISGEPRQIAPL